MLYSEKKGKQFYQSLGKLFYAMAMADKNVRPGEVKKLQDDVRTYWLNLDDLQDEFGTDAAFQIEIVFDWLKNEEKDSDTYFEEFTDFYHEHPEIFTPNIKSLVIHTCNDIAASFAGKNKSELILLARLQNLFNNH
jgi:hypothetical protein